MKNILNADPFSVLRQSFEQTMNTVEFAGNIITAHGELSKEEVEVLLDNETPGKVIDVATKVITAWNKAFAIEEVGGEADKDTQPGKAA